MATIFDGASAAAATLPAKSTKARFRPIATAEATADHWLRILRAKGMISAPATVTPSAMAADRLWAAVLARKFGDRENPHARTSQG